MLSLFPRDVLYEILDLIESVSEGFPTYSWDSLDQFTCWGKYLPSIYIALASLLKAIRALILKEVI